MTTHTFALIAPDQTHYLDVTRVDGDQRAWRDIVLEDGLAQGLITSKQANACSALPAVRPKPPHPVWREPYAS